MLTNYENLKMNPKIELQEYIAANKNNYGRSLQKRKPALHELIKDYYGERVSEKCYNFLNDISSHPTCKICQQQTRFHDGIRGYDTYCSNVCANNDPETTKNRMSGFRSKESIEKRKVTIFEKYGTTSMISINRDKALSTIREKVRTNFWNSPELIKEAGVNLYVYGYFNPEKLMSEQTKSAFVNANIDITDLEHEVFYIGYGVKDRCLAHMRDASNMAKSDHKLNTIRGLIDRGNPPIIKILKDNMTSRIEATDLESKLINEIGTVRVLDNVNSGPLSNQAQGGQGGFTGGIDFIRKLRDSRKDKRWMNNGIEQKFIHETDIAGMELQGWKLGSAPSLKRDAYFAKPHVTKNLKWITNGIDNKRVQNKTLDSYLENGWVLGVTQK